MPQPGTFQTIRHLNTAPVSHLFQYDTCSMSKLISLRTIRFNLVSCMIYYEPSNHASGDLGSYSNTSVILFCSLKLYCLKFSGSQDRKFHDKTEDYSPIHAPTCPYLFESNSHSHQIFRFDYFKLFARSSSAWAKPQGPAKCFLHGNRS